MHRKVLVIKLGSAVITGQDGNINRNVIRKIVGDLSELSKNYRIILVSSGAVSSGKKYLKEYRGTLQQRKAAAAIGNPILIQLYRNYFQRKGQTVAQALCERGHFSNRTQFLQLKETFNTFWANDVIPVVNENDVISNQELKFSDNDELATLLALAFDAITLVFCTSVGGLLDAFGNIIPEIQNINTETLSLVTREKSASGLGGMISKLTFTKLATSLGIKVVMCGLESKRPLSDALHQKCGTHFSARKSTLKNRQKWLAGGSITLGNIYVDKGAGKALRERKSLLSVGVVQVSGSFAAGEVVQLMTQENVIIGVAKSRLSATDLKKGLKTKNLMAAHANDIVLL